ncbi:MAG TPA: hypothetical protein VK879_12105 [Candidatus Sulfomarinibacteraceae bacterium]|nr:hypothetical protein [Candidatus Sulfomarinibacteraceae bacterium]
MHSSTHSNVTRLLLFLLAAAWLLPFPASAAERGQDGPNSVYLPLVKSSARHSCDISDTTFGTLRIASPPSDIAAHAHPDLNLAIRGYSDTEAPLELVQYDGPTDDAAPQLEGFFSPARLPDFSRAYHVNNWDWECDCPAGPISEWPVTLLGMETAPRELLYVPDSGYDIGGGYEVMVLYASSNRITLKYTVEDNVVIGYTLHIEDICVDSELLDLYREMDAAGREHLPALRAGQPFARADGQQIKVAVRDSGAFMDPRTQKDWWKAHPLP